MNGPSGTASLTEAGRLNTCFFPLFQSSVLFVEWSQRAIRNQSIETYRTHISEYDSQSSTDDLGILSNHIRNCNDIMRQKANSIPKKIHFQIDTTDRHLFDVLHCQDERQCNSSVGPPHAILCKGRTFRSLNGVSGLAVC
ncbi:hypothetical protein AB6A40_011110 [Gnathostoma spinigerum]|uniref:Uncharacterized protein n=1 Tax=Gnathostoma spinigerum TaxID=75299 RepID=A0ABD6F2E6_9BILA